MKDDIVNVGIIGTGKWAIQHIGLLLLDRKSVRNNYK